MDRWKTSFLRVASWQVLGFTRRANTWKAILKSTCRWRARRARDSSDIWTRSRWMQKSALFFSISFPRVWKQFYCSTSFLVSFFSKVLQRRFCIRAIPTWPSSCDPRPSRPKGDRNWWGSEMPTKARNVGLGFRVACSYTVVFYARPCAHFSLWRHSLLTGCDFIVLIVIIIVVMIIIIIIVMVMKM